MARLFFAIWPDEDAARRLAALAREVAARLDGRPVPPGKIHLTLAFLGEVAPERLCAATRAAEAIVGEPFGLEIDRLGSFGAAHVAWAGASRPPQALLGLQSALATRLLAGGFALEERAFAPHLTLARRIGRALAPEAVEPVGWEVTHVRLVRTDAGPGTYSMLASWPLEGR